MKNITFINAGAGSGKTYSLTSQLVENIKDGKCQANEVVLTTFTEKAANEFKAKAHEALISAGLTDQANLLTSAAMGTVHSVAFQLLKDYWYHTKLGVNLNVLPQEDTDFFINQALADVPSSEELEQLSEIANELEFPGERYGSIDEDLWKKQLIRIIEIALSFQIVDLEDCKQKSLEEVDNIYPLNEVKINVDLIRKQLKQLQGILPDERESGKKKERIEKTDDLLGGNKYTISYFRKVKTLFDGLGVNLGNKISEFNTTQNQLANLQYTEPVISRLKLHINLVFDLAIRSIEKYKLYKKENNLIDFNDMEVYFWELLKNKKVEEDLKKRCKLVFVDEFQDSSPMQVQIFSKLSEIAKQSYWVGDPKQAIFNFRGTDPALIQGIIDEFGKNDDRNLNIKNLAYSWRSRPQIVNLTNSIFREALASQVSNAKHIELKAVRQEKELPNDNLHFPLQHWHFDDNIRQKKENFNQYLALHLEDFLKIEDRFVADKERSHYDLKEEHKLVKRVLNPKDIAILRYSNNNVAALANNLKNRGIKASAQQKGLINTAEIQLLLATLNYIKDENDSLAKATILLLAGKFEKTEDLIDNRLEYLHSLGEQPIKVENENDDDQDIELTNYYKNLNVWGNENNLIIKLNKIRKKISVLDVPGLIQSLINHAAISDQVSKWDHPEQRKSNLQTAISLAVKYDQRCLLLNIGASLQGFIEYLNSFEEEELVQGAAKGINAVNILTYHKSKGLEWPVVILTDLDNDRLSETSLIRRSFHGVSRYNESNIDVENPFNNQTIILLPWPFGAKRNVPDDLANLINQSERFKSIYKKEEDETKRLLYVGMTRARDYLITTSFKNKDLVWAQSLLTDANIQQNIVRVVENFSKIDLFGKKEPILVEKIFIDASHEIIEKKPINSQIYKKQSVETENDLKYRSPSLEIGSSEVLVSIVKDFNHRIELSKGLSGSEAKLGNCLHSIFYHYKQSVDEISFYNTAKTIIENFGFTGLIPHPNHTFVAIKNLYSYLTDKYGEPVSIYRELPLQMAIDGYVFRGEADLLWETADSLVLIDYKSYPGKKEHVIDPIHNKFSGRYSGQLETYKKMIELSHPEKKKISEILIYYGIIGLLVKI